MKKNLFFILVCGCGHFAQAQDTTQGEDRILTIPYVAPEFPGGKMAMMRYLAEHTHYPQNAMRSGIEGKVYVTFLVEEDGSLTDIKALRGIGGGCDEEAIRVVSNMPKWSPGRKNDRSSTFERVLKIDFKLH